MRTSRIRQEASVARPEFSKSAPEKNASPRMPNERMSLQVELATEASSSTTITSVDSLAFALGATVVINLEVLRGKVLLSFGTGERFTVRSSRPRKPRWAAEYCARFEWQPKAVELGMELVAPGIFLFFTADRERLTLNRHSNHNPISARMLCTLKRHLN